MPIWNWMIRRFWCWSDKVKAKKILKESFWPWNRGERTVYGCSVWCQSAFSSDGYFCVAIPIWGTSACINWGTDGRLKGYASKDVITADSDITGHIEFIPLANNAEEMGKKNIHEFKKLLRSDKMEDKWFQMRVWYPYEADKLNCLFRGVRVKKLGGWYAAEIFKTKFYHECHIDDVKLFVSLDYISVCVQSFAAGGNRQSFLC